MPRLQYLHPPWGCQGQQQIAGAQTINPVVSATESSIQVHVCRCTSPHLCISSFVKRRPQKLRSQGACGTVHHCTMVRPQVISDIWMMTNNSIIFFTAVGGWVGDGQRDTTLTRWHRTYLSRSWYQVESAFRIPISFKRRFLKKKSSVAEGVVVQYIIALQYAQASNYSRYLMTNITIFSTAVGR